MDLFDRFAGADSWHTRRLLEAAQTMTDEQLDRPISGTVQLTPWEKPERSVRELLERIVFTKEVWAAAIGGGEMPGEDTDKSAAGLLARFDKIDKQFENALREVHRRGAWDDTFVDALCDPPETFTFGGTFTHVIAFNTHRRLTALDAMRRLGAKIDGFGCPSEYENSLKAGAAK